ncbi:amidohydrolase [Acidobacteriota bacterium]
MVKRFFVVAVAACYLFMAGGCSKKAQGPVADLVIKNAKIVTIDKDNPRAEAVAIKGEFIIAVTENKEIDSYIEEGITKVIDAKGRLLVPGFNDAHIHFGPVNPDYIDLRYLTDSKIITERVKEQVAKSKPGELITGGRWEHEMFHDKKWPTKELIDPVSPDNPVRLSRADGHSILVNSYILKASGITKDTPDPFGGEIQRDPETGEPTGILKESARRIIKLGDVKVERTPEEQEKRRKEGWKAALGMAARLGVTSIQHLQGRYEEFQKLLDEGNLTCRVTFNMHFTEGKGTPFSQEHLDKMDALQKHFPQDNNWLRFGYLKGYVDGTLGSGTAMFFEPFSDDPTKSGLPQMSYEDLEQKIVGADKMGFQVGIHAIGPKGNNWILNAFEKAQQVNGKRDSRHRSEHAQFISLEDIQRFAELGVIASMQPTHCITDKRFAEKRVGKERCKGAYAWRSLLNVGANIAFGTDYGVEPLDPLEGLYASVTRKDRLGEPGPGWFPEELLTMEEAIELYTLGSAYAEFMEDRKGKIKTDCLADMVIFNNDLMEIPHDQIMTSKVDYTIVGGKVVYLREGAN